MSPLKSGLLFCTKISGIIRSMDKLQIRYTTTMCREEQGRYSDRFYLLDHRDDQGVLLQMFSTDFNSDTTMTMPDSISTSRVDGFKLLHSPHSSRRHQLMRCFVGLSSDITTDILKHELSLSINLEGALGSIQEDISFSPVGKDEDGDDAICERVLKIENKDIFVDLKSNQNGVYLKISERNGANRSSVLIPSSGIQRLTEVLQEIVSSQELKESIRSSSDKGVSPLRAERDANAEVKQRSVYVSNLTWNTDESELKEHMKQAGNVLNTVILRRNTRSLGCGIVEYATREMAWNAVKIMNDSDLNGRSIHVREDKAADAVEVVVAAPVKSSPRPRKQAEITREEKVVEPCKVFVSNLTWATSEEELVACFCSVGDVVGVEIRQTRGGRSLGCGVVEFSTPSYARACIETMNGKDLNGRDMSIREYYQ